MQIAYFIRRISRSDTWYFLQSSWENCRSSMNYEGGAMKHSISYLCSPYARRKKFVAEIFTLDCIES